MKIITVEDCKKLYDDFMLYSETAEQHEFVKLMMIDLGMNRIPFEELIKNQSEARSMFRVVLRALGKDYSEYKEEE